MKAWEAKRISIQPLFDSLIGEITCISKDGETSLAKGIDIPGEVAKMLAADGYDVKFLLSDCDEVYSVIISWTNSEKGKEGTITMENVIPIISVFCSDCCYDDCYCDEDDDSDDDCVCDDCDDDDDSDDDCNCDECDDDCCECRGVGCDEDR